MSTKNDGHQQRRQHIRVRRAEARAARRQTATNAYTGPLHQEQYMPALMQLFNAGALAPGGVYDVEVVHDEEDDGNVVELVLQELHDSEGQQGQTH